MSSIYARLPLSCGNFLFTNLFSIAALISCTDFYLCKGFNSLDIKNILLLYLELVSFTYSTWKFTMLFYYRYVVLIILTYLF